MRNRRGALLPLVAVTLVGLLALIALAVDGGALQRQRRIAQNAADAGALAGAMEIYRVHTDSEVWAAVDSETARNGFVNGQGVSITRTHPTSPDHFTGASYVKVVIDDTVSTAFAGFIGRQSVVVRATAFGGIIPPSGDCIVSLDTAVAKALAIDGGADVTASNCGIRVNSKAAGGGQNDALYVASPGSTLDASGGTINVTGGSSGTTVPPANEGVARVANPLAYITMPAFDHTCTYTNKVVNTGGVTTTLGPGTYCGGLTVQSGAIVELTSGDYFLLGGGLTVKNNNTVLRSLGSGVTFISTWDATHPYGRLDLEAGTQVYLSANTNGVLPGILYYQDPSVPGTAGTGGNANQLQSAAGSFFTGSVYFPTQDVEIHSGASLEMHGGLVARRVHIYNSGTTVTFTSTGAGVEYFRLRRASVVE